jgi:hypothetical protein
MEIYLSDSKFVSPNLNEFGFIPSYDSLKYSYTLIGGATYIPKIYLKN